MSSSASKVPDGLFFELSPWIVSLVRVVNVAVLLLVLITFILSMVRGSENSAYYLLACNIVISALVGLVVNYWYRSGDLGSEKFWYILVVAGVLAFQCITTDIYVYKVMPESHTTPGPSPVNSTHIYSWVTFRPTNKSVLQQLVTPDPGRFYTP